MTTSERPSILPPLTAAEEAHSAALQALIRERIRGAGGWLPFETFMELALYAPGLGYYSAGATKLGPAGDFVTAPEVSDLFSRCVARQCAEILAATGGGEILEFGAGTGRMAAVVLEELEASGVLPERYAILEVSADLRERQRARIASLSPALAERVVWLDRLPERPVRGVMLANEVLDALPCHRFEIGRDGALALGVALDEAGRLVEAAGTPDEALRAALDALLGELPSPLPPGYRSEINLRVEPWIAAVAERLERGVLVIFDYGLPRAHYYHPQRLDGTLRCHFRQRAHDDPLVNVGLQDITAWVDFTRVAEAAHAAGLEVLGFATQAAFLLGAGIDTLAADDGDPVARARRASEVRQLLMPGEMGEAFKAMALGRGCDDPPGAWRFQDLRGSL